MNHQILEAEKESKLTGKFTGNFAVFGHVTHVGSVFQHLTFLCLLQNYYETGN